VEVSQGVFRYVLEPTATNWETGTYFLQTTVEGTVLTPREELVSSVYALQAKSVDDGAITAAKIANGAVTSDKIAAGSVGPAKIAVNQFYDITVASASNVVPTIASGNYFNNVKVSSAIYADSANTAATATNATNATNATTAATANALASDSNHFNNVKVSSAIYADSANTANTATSANSATTATTASGLASGNYLNDVRVSSAIYAESAAIGSGDYLNDVKVSSAIYADTANTAATATNATNATTAATANTLASDSNHFNNVKVSSAIYADSAIDIECRASTGTIITAYNGNAQYTGVVIYSSMTSTLSGCSTFYLTNDGTETGTALFTSIYSANATAKTDTAAAISVPLASIKFISEDRKRIIVNVVIGINLGVLGDTIEFAQDGTQVYLTVFGQ
jgi:hypothetical protein